MMKPALALFVVYGLVAACSGTDFAANSPKIEANKPAKTTTGTGDPTKNGTTSGSPGKGTTGGTGNPTTTGNGTSGSPTTGGNPGMATTGTGGDPGMGATGGTGTPGAATAGATVGATTGGTGQPQQPAIVDQQISVSHDAQCTTNLGYNPSQVQCNISAGGDSIWANTDGWREALGRFTDKQASWISPLAAVADNQGHPMCQLLDGTEKLFYVTYVNITSPGAHNIEALMDDQGAVHVWKRADPNQEVYVSPGLTAEAKGGVNLEAAGYAIVVEAQDVSKAATGMTFSIKGPGGNVIKRSVADGSWCIFRVPAATDVRSWLPGAAACKQCFGGTQP
jgi:hypothetical protein